MKPLVECVPNFSEGRDQSVIQRIVEVISKTEGVKVIGVDPGKATNRTVVTFVGEPAPVCEAAFNAVKIASELIDMSRHKGEHPRFGATDVLPLIPIRGITMEETVEYARRLAGRIGNELNIPVYCYEHAASDDKRRNLAECRSGEYEGLAQKLSDPEWKPDFGPDVLNAHVVRTGATAVGARNFLIAYNINLNTTSTRWANAIAFDIREKGRVKREGNPLTGKIVRDAGGEPVYVPGLLKGVKGIGWFIEEYGIAQLSFNITDTSRVSLHQLFELACERAAARGIRVTGSELVGVVPLQMMIDTGKYFLRKQKRSTGIPDSEILKIAVKSLGLDELAAFDPSRRIIEYLIEDSPEKKLVDLTVRQFTHLTASESVAPGGGSVSACMGALGVALGTMVANLSSHKKGWEHHWEEFSDWADKGKCYHEELLELVDEDTRAYNGIIAAFGMPKKTDAEKAERTAAVQEATRYAMEVPFRVAEAACNSMEVMLEMVKKGNPNSVSDAGVGALAARSAVKGASLNVQINALDLKDKQFASRMIEEVKLLEAKAQLLEDEIIGLVKLKLKEV